MKELIGVGILAVIGAASLIFFVPLLGAIFGAFSGWVVGLFFDETMATFIQWLEVEASPWQIGAVLGFVGGFFKSVLQQSRN